VPKKAVLSAAVTGLVAQTLPALAVVRAPPREENPARIIMQKTESKSSRP
jgi:hypothetical protein